MASRCDLHLHSRYSDRSAEWLFRRFGFPDSYSEPRTLYAALIKRGMSFVTITDHNRIEGCLEIAELPGTFISEQVSAFFPEDRCQVHLLVWGMNEEQHREIGRLRENIYELQGYLVASSLAHAVAHPLYKLDEKFSAAHLQKLILLFRCFEAVNGLRDALGSDVARDILERLTPERIAQFAEQHRLEPTGEEPWKKVYVGGSDDHGGMFAASAWTETRDLPSPAEFLREIRNGGGSAHGAAGGPLILSHSLYKTVYAYLSDRFSDGRSYDLIEKTFSRFMEGSDPTEFSFGDKMGFLAQGIASGKIWEFAKPKNASLWKEFATYFGQSDVKDLLAQETRGVAEPERRAFLMANLFANQLAFRFFTKFVKRLSSGNIIESLQDLSTMAPILLMLSPYIYAFHSQSPSRRWLRQVAVETSGEIPPALRNTKRAWFTDTLEDVNGVANTIRKMTAACVELGHDLVVVTSRTTIHIDDIPIKNFAPIGEFELPEYELQKLSFPPILRIVDYIQKEKFTEVIISTPGPIGITALLAAKMLGLRTSGIYHTDFPQYVRILTEDTFLETLTWNFMRWFYSQLDLIYVNSEHYRQCWIERGIAAEKIHILPRGLDTILFHPSRREEDFWVKRGLAGEGVVLLYVGRISKEKDLDLLASAYHKLRAAGTPVRLAIVGDGPYLAELKKLVPDACFTGLLAGAELATAFASADLFVFPSTTDTYGNVVVEALASGLPAIVSDQGGPKELIAHGVTGLITRGLDARDFAAAIQRLVDDSALRETMRRCAREAVEKRDWNEAAERFWAIPKP